MKPRAPAITAILCALSLSAPTNAFNEPGHFETVRLLVEEFLVPPAPTGSPVFPLQPNERGLVEFCSQLPDMVDELDAVHTYIHAVGQWSLPVTWISWGLFNHPMTDEYRRMIVVQQTIHALTGGDALAMRRVAITSIRELLAHVVTVDPARSDRTIQLCALGLGFHLFGDSFAHVVMSWNKDVAETTLYPTGRGHAFDWHYPDLVLCNYLSKDAQGDTDCHQSTMSSSSGSRFAAWVAYWTMAGPAISDKVNPPVKWNNPGSATNLTAASKQFVDRVIASVLSINSAKDLPSPQNADLEVGTKLHAVLNQTLASAIPPFDDSLEKLVSSSQSGTLTAPPCRQLLRSGALALAIRSGAVLDGSNCLALWRAYYPTVIGKMKDCQSGGGSQMPECVSRSPVDSAWQSWLKNDSQELEQFAQTLVFN